jgi:hypothetical protein
LPLRCRRDACAFVSADGAGRHPRHREAGRRAEEAPAGRRVPVAGAPGLPAFLSACLSACLAGWPSVRPSLKCRLAGLLPLIVLSLLPGCLSIHPAQHGGASAHLGCNAYRRYQCLLLVECGRHATDARLLIKGSISMGFRHPTQSASLLTACSWRRLRSRICHYEHATRLLCTSVLCSTHYLVNWSRAVQIMLCQAEPRNYVIFLS